MSFTPKLEVYSKSNPKDTFYCPKCFQTMLLQGNQSINEPKFYMHIDVKNPCNWKP